MDEITIKTEYIKLDQLLKFSGAADSGSTAKAMIQGEIVKLNGEVCSQRGRKIRNGDIVEITETNEKFKIIFKGE
ncbi:MAG: RNA-binding S4 domain-containing protein [Eubacteriaceae bacterium]|nr:RNA-binding S4 domain-containing protein [Eubacteriaceae bacterium]